MRADDVLVLALLGRVVLLLLGRTAVLFPEGAEVLLLGRVAVGLLLMVGLVEVAGLTEVVVLAVLVPLALLVERPEAVPLPPPGVCGVR